MRTNAFLDVMQELVAFVRVAEAGSFSKAAQLHGLTPSAVSRQVARLEKVMGVTLLQRTTRQLRLTEVGFEVLERGQAMVAAAQASLQAAEAHVSTPKGLIRLSAPKAFARHVLDQPLRSFLAQYPEVDLHLLVVDRPVDPLREGIDLVVRMTDAPPPGLVARPLMPVRQLVVASPGYLATHASILHPKDLRAHSCLAIGEEEHDSHWRFRRAGEEIDVVVSGRYTLNHSVMRLHAIEAGLGVGCVSDFVALDALEKGSVQPLLSDWHFDTNYQGMAHLLFTPARHTAPKIRALIDHLVHALRPVT